MRNAMRGSHVRVKVYVHPYVRVNRVASSEEGMEAGCYTSILPYFYDPEGDARKAMG